MSSHSATPYGTHRPALTFKGHAVPRWQERPIAGLRDRSFLLTVAFLGPPLPPSEFIHLLEPLLQSTTSLLTCDTFATLIMSLLELDSDPIESSDDRPAHHPLPLRLLTVPARIQSSRQRTIPYFDWDSDSTHFSSDDESSEDEPPRGSFSSLTLTRQPDNFPLILVRASPPPRRRSHPSSQYQATSNVQYEDLDELVLAASSLVPVVSTWLQLDPDAVSADTLQTPSQVQNTLQEELDDVPAKFKHRQSYSTVSRTSVLHLITRMVSVIINNGIDRTLPFYKSFNPILLNLLEYVVRSGQDQILLDLTDICVLDEWALTMDGAIENADKESLKLAFTQNGSRLGATRKDWKETGIFIYQWLLIDAKDPEQAREWWADLYNGSTLEGDHRWHTYDLGFHRSTDQYVHQRAQKYNTLLPSISANLSLLDDWPLLLLLLKPLIEQAHMFVFNSVVIFSAQLGNKEENTSIMRNFISHCRQAVGLDNLLKFRANPANRSLPTHEPIRLPWFQDEIDFIKAENVRVSRAKLETIDGDFDKWIAPRLKARFGISRGHTAIGKMRRRYGLLRQDGTWVVEHLGLAKSRDEVVSFVDDLFRSGKTLTRDQFISVFSEHFSIQPFSYALATKLVDWTRGRPDRPDDVPSMGFLKKGPFQQNTLRTLDGVQSLLKWLVSYDNQPEDFPWNSPTMWTDGVKTFGLDTTRKEIVNLLVPKGFTLTDRKKAGQEAYRQQLIAKTRALVSQAERNAEHLILRTNAQGGKESRYIGPGEIRVIQRYTYKLLAENALVKKLPFTPFAISQNKEVFAAQLDLAFPTGYQDGENLSGIGLRSALIQMWQPAKDRKDRVITRDSYAGSLNKDLQQKLFEYIETSGRDMTVEEATDRLASLEFCYNLDKKSFEVGSNVSHLAVGPKAASVSQGAISHRQKKNEKISATTMANNAAKRAQESSGSENEPSSSPLKVPKRRAVRRNARRAPLLELHPNAQTRPATTPGDTKGRNRGDDGGKADVGQ